MGSHFIYYYSDTDEAHYFDSCGSISWVFANQYCYLTMDQKEDAWVFCTVRIEL